MQEKRGGYVCPGYPQCENTDCDCAGPQSEEEQEEGGAADWKEDLLNWETMGDDPPETEAEDVKESDEEDKETGKETEPCICVLCMSETTHNLYIKATEKAKKVRASSILNPRWERKLIRRRGGARKPACSHLLARRKRKLRDSRRRGKKGLRLCRRRREPRRRP